MACVFREAIARRIVSAIKSSIIFDEEIAIQKLAPLVKIQKHKTENAKFILNWNEAHKLLCEKNRNLDSEVLNLIRGPKGLILADGLQNVTLFEDGVIGFSVNENLFTREVLRDLHNIGDEWRERNCLIGSILRENMIVEYSSPNIAKTFHVGHLRSTIIGNAIANMYEFVNHKVTRINYLGDWGTQYGLLSVGYQKFGSDEELEKEPLQYLYSIYVAANNEAKNNPDFVNEAKEHFNRLERNDKSLLQWWKKFRDISVTEYQKTYKRLGARFDIVSGESEYHKSAAQIVEQLLNERLAVKSSDGLVTIRIPYTSEPEKDVPIAKSDGSSLYLSRDVAAAIDRKNRFHFDRMCYVVDNRQSDHFVCLKNILQKMGYEWHDTLHHIKYGHIHGMSSRTGMAVFLDELLDEAKTRARKGMELSQNIKVDKNRDEVADILGISGLIVFDLSHNRTRNYEFDWKQALATTRDSGIALQYTHVRLCGLERETERTLKVDCETNVLQEPEALLLIHHLARFDEVICETVEKVELTILVRYLFRLSHLVGSAYTVLPIKGQDRVTAKARFLLFHCAKEVLNVGMKLIGLKPLDKM